MNVDIVGRNIKNGNIVEYIISDGVSNRSINPKELKNLIRDGKISVSGFKLTCDNRLIRCKEKSNTLYYLMNKDTIVGVIDLNKNTLNLRKSIIYNIPDIRAWLDKRARFTCARNTKEFFSSIGVSDIEDFIAIFYCISLQDTFWVRKKGDNIKWATVSPFRNNYSEYISNYALDGILCGNSKNYFSPDISTNGSFPHTWKWYDNKIVFVKASSKYTLGGTNSGREPYSEYFASTVCDYLGYKHVKYKIREHRRVDGRLDIVTECLCFTSEKIGSISASDLGLTSYTSVIDYCKSLSKNALNTILDMLFLDCLLLNTDRHFSNIEFLVDNKSQEVIDIAPIFDNNYALLPRFIEGYDEFNRSDYVSRSGDTFEKIYSEIKRYKDYTMDLSKLKNFSLVQPNKVPISDSRLSFLNNFIKAQVEYWIKK